MRRAKLLTLGLVTAALLLGMIGSGRAIQQADAREIDTATIITFDRPGPPCQPSEECIVPNAVNAFGAVTGIYNDPAPGFRIHGFVRSPVGVITTIDLDPISINLFGLITGETAVDANDDTGGFLRFPDGRVTTFVAPEKTRTTPTAINAAGEITGTVCCYAGNLQGFIRTLDGNFAFFDAAGSAETRPTAINLAGSVTGSYSDFVHAPLGFIRHPSGVVDSIAVPGAVAVNPSSISLDGTIAGTYLTGSQPFFPSHGFIRSRDGSISTFKVAGKDVATAIISPTGTIAGSIVDIPGSGPHGYVRNVDGSTALFDPPGSQGTEVRGINAFGVIVGSYQDANNRTLGFLRVPSCLSSGQK